MKPSKTAGCAVDMDGKDYSALAHKRSASGSESFSVAALAVWQAGRLGIGSLHRPGSLSGEPTRIAAPAPFPVYIARNECGTS